MTNFSHIPFPSSAAFAGLSLIAQNTVFYVSPTGNDTNATGTTAAPYGTLYGVMEAVRKFQIIGSATVTIRLMKGEHTISSNIDLYHPQGANLIIEGDPDAFAQRVLWSVEGYSWNPANFAGGGHSGTVKLFNPATGAVTSGFTSADLGMYFSITNAALGARSGYKTGATSGIWSDSLYGSQDIGDRFFNHGISHEEGQGILGIGRLLSYTDEAGVVEFKNPNYDSRCPAWHMDGGSNNSTAWAGIASNYPETQYSRPNGYYGNGAWSSVDGTVAYPQKPAGAAHNSTDPFLLSYYPVVIRAPYASNTGTLFLKNGSLKALRNIFFAASTAPFTLVDGSTGSTANYSQALSALSDQRRDWSENGVAIALENAELPIRHLGFYGTGVAIAAHNSRIIAYTSGGIVGGEIQYGTIGSLDNSPIMCVTQCKHGLYAKNSVIDFTDSSGLSKRHSQNYQDASCHLSTTGRAIDLLGTQFKANYVHVNGHCDVPKFLCQIVVPVYFGTTSAGVTQAFLSYQNDTSFWTAYPTAKLFLKPAVGNEQEIGYVNYVVDSSSLSEYTGVNGSTASATPTLAGLHPVDYRVYNVYGVKTAPSGLLYMTTADLRLGITSGAAGGNFSIRFYTDTAATIVGSEYGISPSSVYVKGTNGITLGYTGVASAHTYVKSLVSTGTNNEYAYCGHGNNAISAMDASTVHISKALIIQNGGYLPVEVRDGSNLVVGDEQVNTDSEVVGTGEGDTRNDLVGSVCVTGFTKHAVLAADNSFVRIGSLFVKHPLHTSTSENATTTVNNVARAENNSSMLLGNVYAVMHTALPSVLGLDGANGTGLWTSISNTRYGHKDYPLARNEGVIGAFRNSSISFSDIGEQVFHFDGGTPQFSFANRNMALLSAGKGGSVYIPDPNQISSVVNMNSNVAFRFTTDRRSINDRKIMTRAAASTNSGPYIYDRPSSDDQRAWRGKVPSTTPRMGVEGGNIGVAASATDNAARINAPITGVTYSIFIHDASSYIFK